ncbi:MAG TPA: DNA repair protein RecO [Elainellaceae cyanobacterium]
MSGTYKVTGINLKSIPLGESDRLLTVLTPEQGLIRAVAPGARKHKSSLRGRSSLFAVNELLIAKGRSLDKIVQAEGLESFPNLSQDLGTLTASQYLAEVALCQALSQQPQAELFALVCEHLRRLVKQPQSLTLACLVHAVFHLLVVAGLAPQVQVCCVTQQPVVPDFSNQDWRIGFSAAAGGTVQLSELERLASEGYTKPHSTPLDYSPPSGNGELDTGKVSDVNKAIAISKYAVNHGHRYSDQPERRPRHRAQAKAPELCILLNATELALFQQLANPHLPQLDGELCGADLSREDEVSSHIPPNSAEPIEVWLSIERTLRHYAQYHLERPIRSAALIETCFTPLLKSS